MTARPIFGKFYSSALQFVWWNALYENTDSRDMMHVDHTKVDLLEVAENLVNLEGQIFPIAMFLAKAKEEGRIEVNDELSKAIIACVPAPDRAKVAIKKSIHALNLLVWGIVHKKYDLVVDLGDDQKDDGEEWDDVECGESLLETVYGFLQLKQARDLILGTAKDKAFVSVEAKNRHVVQAIKAKWAGANGAETLKKMRATTIDLIRPCREDREWWEGSYAHARLT
jgi:hypothetical protein